MKTTLFSVLATAVRIGAVLHVVNTFAALMPFFLTLPAGPDKSTQWIALGGGLASAAAAVLLWLYPGLLVRPALGRAAHEVLESPLQASDIQRIGLCLLGVWLAINGIVDFCFVLLRSNAASYVLQTGDALSLAMPDLVYYALKALFGIALTLGSRGLTGVLQRLRGRSAQAIPGSEAVD